MQAPTIHEPVGVCEIAHRVGVLPETVSQWWRRTRRGEMRHPMPPPRGTVSNMEWWDWPEVEPWLRDTGRLKDPAA